MTLKIAETTNGDIGFIEALDQVGGKYPGVQAINPTYKRFEATGTADRTVTSSDAVTLTSPLTGALQTAAIDVTDGLTTLQIILRHTGGNDDAKVIVTPLGLDASDNLMTLFTPKPFQAFDPGGSTSPINNGSGVYYTETKYWPINGVAKVTPHVYIVGNISQCELWYEMISGPADESIATPRETGGAWNLPGGA